MAYPLRHTALPAGAAGVQPGLCVIFFYATDAYVQHLACLGFAK